MKLDYEFYNRHSVIVAKELLGKKLVFGDLEGVITETEAYRGMDDPASHAYKLTPRSIIMRGDPGYSYVYMIYGMYYLLNVSTEEYGMPGAVLIRGVKLEDRHLDGPGKICKYFGIDKRYNGVNMLIDNKLYIADSNFKPNFTTTSRIGITKATDKLWRFVINL